jgi:hypothetical protein
MSINWFDVGIDIAQTVAAFLAAGSIVYAVRSYRTARGHLGFEVIQSCMIRFQSIIGDLESSKTTGGTVHDLRATHVGRAISKRYIDLCSEELFYFQMGYVPEEIMDEWIDGMLSYLPLKDKAGKIVYPSYKLKGILRRMT